eukprot:1372554-Amphidinium_carterae.1
MSSSVPGTAVLLKELELAVKKRPVEQNALLQLGLAPQQRLIASCDASVTRKNKIAWMKWLEDDETVEKR